MGLLTEQSGKEFQFKDIHHPLGKDSSLVEWQTILTQVTINSKGCSLVRGKT
jgi:hypothetical protein